MEPQKQQPHDFYLENLFDHFNIFIAKLTFYSYRSSSWPQAVAAQPADRLGMLCST